MPSTPDRPISHVRVLLDGSVEHQHTWICRPDPMDKFTERLSRLLALTHIGALQEPEYSSYFCLKAQLLNAVDVVMTDLETDEPWVE